MSPRRETAKYSTPKPVLYHHKMNLDLGKKNLHTVMAIKYNNFWCNAIQLVDSGDILQMHIIYVLSLRHILMLKSKAVCKL